MRGKTVKKIRRFVDVLIANTPPEQIIKSKKQMVEDVKKFWVGNPEAKKFVQKTLNGESITCSVEKK